MSTSQEPNLNEPIGSLMPDSNAGLHYDEAGNAFIRDANSTWIPHCGYALSLARSVHQPNGGSIQGPCHLTHSPTVPRHWSVNPSLTLRPVEVQQNPGSAWMLSTPSFMQRTDQDVAPATLLPPGPAGQNSMDPTAIPLPRGDNAELSVPHVIAQAQGHDPSSKIAGARRRGVKPKNEKTKGKEKEKENIGAEKSKKRSRAIIKLDADDDDELSRPATKRGRPNGANNYSVANTKLLLDCIEAELPLGPQGWLAVTLKFNQRATKLGCPECKVTSLETKFKQLVKTKKPTGDGICPPEIQWGHYIDGLINEQAGTRDLGDSDFNDMEGDKTESSTDNNDVPPSEPRVAVARSSCNEAPVPRHTTCGTAATELLHSLSNAFDPAVQKVHDADRASRSLANTQLLTLSQQLWDAQATNNKLRGQLFNLRNRLHESQRATDHAELHLEMMKAPRKQIYHNMPKDKRQSYRWFADGGEALAWLSDNNEDQWEVDEDDIYPNKYTSHEAGPSKKVFEGTPEL